MDHGLIDNEAPRLELGRQDECISGGIIPADLVRILEAGDSELAHPQRRGGGTEARSKRARSHENHERTEAWLEGGHGLYDIERALALDELSHKHEQTLRWPNTEFTPCLVPGAQVPWEICQE